MVLIAYNKSKTNYDSYEMRSEIRSRIYKNPGILLCDSSRVNNLDGCSWNILGATRNVQELSLISFSTLDQFVNKDQSEKYHFESGTK